MQHVNNKMSRWQSGVFQIFICLFLTMSISNSNAQNVPSDEISIIVPRQVIANMVAAALPLNLEKERYLKGTLWIHAIDHLEIGTDAMTFDMDVRGKNIQFETRLGSQTLLMDIGSFDSVFSCKVSLRYDAPKRLLYIKPYIFHQPSENETNKMALNLLQLLSLSNGVEYPVEIEKLQPYMAQLNKDQFNINMAITKITTKNNQVFIQVKPQLTKVKQPSFSVETQE